MHVRQVRVELRDALQMLADFTAAVGIHAYPRWAEVSAALARDAEPLFQRAAALEEFWAAEQAERALALRMAVLRPAEMREHHGERVAVHGRMHAARTALRGDSPSL